MAVLRSKKYIRLEDDEILRLFAQQPEGENLHFLQVEIEQRNLQDKLDTLLAKNRKQGRHSVFYYLFYILLLLFFLISFMSEL